MAIEPSPRFAALLLLFHGLAATAVCAAAMPPVAGLAVLLPISLSLFYHMARDILLILPGSWREISTDQGGVSVVARDGSNFGGQVVNGTVVSPYFIVLRLGLEGRRLPVSRVIFPDAVGAGAFRELCVSLRFP